MANTIDRPPFDEVNRRVFLKVLGSAGASAALTSCAGPADKIIPYVIPPEDTIPGVATFFATVCRECPAGCGMLVRTREGRAVKVEGNPEHPINRGGLCVRGQASLQGLYNPDRLGKPMLRRTTNATAGQSVLEDTSWEEAQKALTEKILALRKDGRADRIAVITPLLTGSLDKLVDSWTQAIGARRRLRYEPFDYAAIRAANRLTFGQDAIPTYDFSQARVLLSLGADFLETWLSNVGYARDFAEARKLQGDRKSLFIHVEPRLSMTGANADEWLALEPGVEVFLVLGMVHTILGEKLSTALPSAEADSLTRLVADYSPEQVASRCGVTAQRIRELARVFCMPQASPGASLAVGGGVASSGSNATAVQIAINLLNYVAGNVGRTVLFGADSSYAQLSSYREMLSLVAAMKAGEIELLMVHDVNPLFGLPAAAGFAAALNQVPFVVSFSSFPDETSVEADLILPTHTPLESWGDYQPRVGVHGLMQPVMQPVLETKSFGDLLLAVSKGLGDDVAQAFPAEVFQDYVREEWRGLHQSLAPDAEFEAFWADALRQGGVWRAIPPVTVRLDPQVFQTRFEPHAPEDTERPYTLVAYPSLHHYDGRGANRPWLQEIPDPMTKAVWDSWIEVHPDTATSLKAQQGQLLTIESRHGRIEVPLLLNDRMRPDVLAIPIGQGHTQYGRYAKGRGVNPMKLLSPAPEELSGGPRWLSVKVSATSRELRRPLTTTQGSARQLDRGFAQAISVAALLEHAETREEEHSTLYPPHQHPAHRWGMAIDLNACNGCNACIAACSAENNIPVVGPAQMARGREMSWIRVERYWERRDTRLDVRFVPMLCQHCDHAPCEAVCPTYATYHNPEGLNAQIYNRCVGTGYCSNNCPYKVRYFNWFAYEFPAPLQMQLNPDVTVRSAGVMEKCTFCVQRIQERKDQAKDEGRSVRDGEITPACAQTCPATAIVFGDLNDPRSRVSEVSRDPRGYHVLEELNTRPAITYLKKIIEA